jgi:hypothetical protein
MDACRDQRNLLRLRINVGISAVAILDYVPQLMQYKGLFNL